MIKVIARQDFTSNIGNYVAGDEIELDDMDKITKLNEMGFIEPLSYKDLVELKREIDKQKEKL